MLLKNNHGFGLIGTIIVAALVTTVILSIGGLLDNSFNQFRRAAIKTEVTVLKAQVGSIFQRNTTCVHNLRNENAVSFGATPNYSLTKLMQENSATTFTTNLIPGLGVPTSEGSKLSAVSMALTNTATTNAPTSVLVTATAKLFLTDLRIDFAQPAGEVVLPSLVVGVIRIETDLAGNILNCELIPPVNPSDLCTDLSLTWSGSPNNDCLGTPAQICAGIGSTLDAFGKCISATSLASTSCYGGSFTTGFSSGDIQCFAPPTTTGIWSPWHECDGDGEGDGVQNRSCLIGTCMGPISQGC